MSFSVDNTESQSVAKQFEAVLNVNKTTILKRTELIDIDMVLTKLVDTLARNY